MLQRNISINSAYNKLPKYLIISGIYNVLFQLIGLSYIYILLYLIGFVWSLSKTFSKFRGLDMIVVFYMLIIFLSTIISALLNQQNGEIIYFSSLLFLLPIIFWFLYYITNRNFDFNNLILSLKWHVFIIAIFGLIQYYVSPNLFGIIDVTSNNILWAIDNEEYKSFFRSTSILGSPQVYGAFMSLYILLFIFANNEEKFKLNYRNISYVLFLFIAGAHSANKSFFAVLILYIIYLLYKNRFFIHSVILLSIAMFLISKYKYSLPFLQRVFFNKDILENETERITIWKNAIFSSKIFGDGAGSWSNTSFNLGNDVAESYFLQILTELGLIAFILFVILIIGNLFKIRNSNLFLPSIACVFIMIIVHVFNNPSFILFWGVSLYGLNFRSSKIQYNEKITSN